MVLVRGLRLQDPCKSCTSCFEYHRRPLKPLAFFFQSQDSFRGSYVRHLNHFRPMPPRTLQLRSVLLIVRLVNPPVFAFSSGPATTAPVTRGSPRVSLQALVEDIPQAQAYVRGTMRNLRSHWSAFLRFCRDFQLANTMGQEPS